MEFKLWIKEESNLKIDDDVKFIKTDKVSDFDMQGRKFAKQLEKASKIAKNAIILGEDEIKEGFFSIKNLETSEQKKVNSIDEL